METVPILDADSEKKLKALFEQTLAQADNLSKSAWEDWQERKQSLKSKKTDNDRERPDTRELTSEFYQARGYDMATYAYSRVIETLQHNGDVAKLLYDDSEAKILESDLDNALQRIFHKPEEHAGADNTAEADEAENEAYEDAVTPHKGDDAAPGNNGPS